MSYGMRIMECAAAVSNAFHGAAQFTSGSGSTVTLTSRVPNIFGNDGDFIEFDLFQDSTSAWTVFGSTGSPDAVIVNDDTITITDGTNSDSITLLSSISTTAWTMIKLMRNGSTIECYINGVLELQTLDVIAIDIDIVGKNQSSLDYVYAASLSGGEGDYFSLSSPSADVQGADTGFSRAGLFYLAESGDYCIMDNLSGNDGWRIEVVNVYLDAHRLKWTVGNGTTTASLESTEVFYPQEWIAFECNLEDLDGAEPDVGDTTIEGFSTYATNFYVGSQGGTTNFFSGKLQSLLCLSAPMSANDWTWWTNSGQFRSLDEIGVSTEIATADCTNGWPMSEASGTRADLFGTDDLTEVPGYAYSPTLNNGGFETWNSSTDVDGWNEILTGSSTITQETSTVQSGTYAVSMYRDSGGDSLALRDTENRFTTGRVYQASIYAAITGAFASQSFHLWQHTNSKEFVFTSNSLTQYTYTFPAAEDGAYVTIATSNIDAGETMIVDDLTFQATSIPRVLGVRTSFLTSASFSGYLRNVEISSFVGTVIIKLQSDANDTGGDSNDGTASSVTFVTEDPAA